MKRRIPGGKKNNKKIGLLFNNKSNSMYIGVIF